MKQLLIISTVLLVLIAACAQQQVGNQTPEEETVAIMGELENITVDEPELTIENDAPAQPLPDKYTVTWTEGDLAVLSPQAVDPDGDTVSYAYTTPFDIDGKWQTKYGDEGSYPVTVTATDTKGASSSVPIVVKILHANRAPTLSCPDLLSVKEGEIITIDCEVSDVENDRTLLAYTGWMTDKSYETSFEDAGTHVVTVTADDGSHEVSQNVKITVKNLDRAPEFALDFPTDIVGREGDLLVIDTADITDPDGDTVTFTFGAPFGDDGEWQTKIGDAGTYPVDVIAKSGDAMTKRRINVKLEMANTAPVLKRIADIVVKEGETITLEFEATDREGNAIDYEITGWMTSKTYTTTYSDAGSYSVTVTASDHEFSDSQVVHITVQDQNRPPVFKVPA